MSITQIDQQYVAGTYGRFPVELLSGKGAMLERYRRDCVTLGQQICLVKGDEIRHGTALDIDSQGALIVRFDDGTTDAVNSGEVSIRGMYGYL